MDGLTTDDLNSGNYLSTLRNKAIANHFNMLGEIEKYGSGVSRVIGLFQEAGLPVPVIEEICGGIRVTVRKKVDSRSFNPDMKTRENAGEKTREKTREKIIRIIRETPGITAGQLAEVLEISRKGVEWQLNALKRDGVIARVGPDKGGHWEVLSNGK